MNKQTSLELWRKYGEYLLMAMPYADGLVAEAQGSILKDEDGNELLDLAAGQFCAILGHNHPKLIETIVEQTRKVLHTGTEFLSPVVLETAAKLAGVTPVGLKKSLLFSTGTEANECALSIAKTYTRKTGVVGFNRGYYGLSLAMKSLSAIFGRGDRQGSSPRVPDTSTLLAPHCFRCPVHAHYPACDLLCLKSSSDAIARDAGNIAAVIVEPILSAGGMIVPPPGYLKALKDFTKQHEALLIVDEAQTAFGRTGKWFAVEHHGVEPDILVISKSAGGGFPVSAVITNEQVAERLANEGFVHLSSHQSDPVAAAALGAVIDIVKEEGLVERATKMGEYFLARLKELQARHSIIADIRGQGLMLGMEIGTGDDSNGKDYELVMLIAGLCSQKGVHLTYTYFEPVVRFLPPLTITREQIDFAIGVLDACIGKATQKAARLDDVLPTNSYTESYVRKLSGKKTLFRIATRLYETSPAYWVRKLSELRR